jgi:hypothetical protein
MRKLLQFALRLVMLLALSASVQAQSRGQHSMAARVPIPSGARLVHAVPLRTSLNQTSGTIVRLGDTAFANFGSIADGAFPVPGLGFDYVHLAAVNPRFRATDSPRHIIPIIPIGFPFLPAQVAPQIIVVQQPPVVVLQQPATAEEPSERVGRGLSLEPTDGVAAPRPAEPQREVGEFVLVRLNGTLVFAVAFSAEGNQLIYITREGVRRSLPLAELDVDATRRMNEERGTSFRSPV